MDYDQYWDYHPGDTVMTCDGYPGTVMEVTDGPVPGNIDYLVELHDGMGGGHYTSGQLTKGTNPRTAKEHEATGLHLASEDYEELGTILYDRPDPGRMTFAAARTAVSEPDGATEVRDTAQPDACSYCGSTQFANQTDNGRVRQATCAVCGGTMSAHPGAQWTPELVGDPSNHPSTAVDPASGASGAGGQAGINDLIDFDERVSKSAALASDHGLGHVYRGLHGAHAAQAAEAHRNGELGSGMHGKGVYTTSSPDLAISYAQDYMGDRTGVVMHGQVRPDASVARLDEVPRRVREGGGSADWAREQGHDVLTDGANTHIAVNPHAVAWDPHDYGTTEAYHRFSPGGDNYGDGPHDLLKHAAADGPDWCTWRQASQCTFPNDRNNNLLATPQVRGACPWNTRWEQQVCPISEPGPGSGVSRKASVESSAHQAALEAKMAGIPAGKCKTCKGKGKLSHVDIDEGWQGDPDENPGKTFTASCDDCGGTGRWEAMSDEDLAEQQRRNEQDKARQKAEHMRRHPDWESRNPTFEETKLCDGDCPAKRKFDKLRGNPFARITSQMRTALGPNSASRPASSAPAHRTAVHLDLYHRTSPEAAKAILRDKRMDAKEADGSTYWSTSRGDDPSSSVTDGYGSGLVHVRVPEHLAELEDEFSDGEQHYRVPKNSLKPHHFVED